MCYEPLDLSRQLRSHYPGACGHHPAGRRPLEMIRSAIAGIPHVEVDAFSGLQVDYVRRMGADAVVRGLRTIGDFAAEQELDACNRKLYPDMETIFFMTSPAYTFVSSSAVREVGRFGGDLSGFVPGCIQEQVARRLRGD